MKVTLERYIIIVSFIIVIFIFSVLYSQGAFHAKYCVPYDGGKGYVAIEGCHEDTYEETIWRFSQ